MGLSEEAAGRIIKGVQNQRLIGNLQAVKASGALTLDKVLRAVCCRDTPGCSVQSALLCGVARRPLISYTGQ